MPDLVTHFGTAYLIKRFPSWTEHRVPFYLGAILPDLLSRPIHVLFPKAEIVTYSLHTPIFVFFICLLMALAFDRPLRKGVRLNLLLGAGLHFGMDVMQRHVAGGYQWLFPFSLKSFELGWFWPEASIRIVPFWILLLAGSEIWGHFRKKQMHQRI